MSEIAVDLLEDTLATLKESSKTAGNTLRMTEDEFRAFTDDISGHWEGEDGLEYQRRIRADWNQRREEADEERPGIRSTQIPHFSLTLVPGIFHRYTS